MTSAQSGLLFVLGRRDGVLMGEAGAALDLGMPGISGLAERMVEAGLIEKRADPDDGRAWRLWLTAAGRKALARSKAGAAELNRRLMDGFTRSRDRHRVALAHRRAGQIPQRRRRMTEHIRIEQGITSSP